VALVYFYALLPCTGDRVQDVFSGGASGEPAPPPVNSSRARSSYDEQESRSGPASSRSHHVAEAQHQLLKGDDMTAKPDLPIIAFASSNAWETWLEKHHATANGLWLKIAKKGSGIDTVSYAEALDVALCYGWIDGQKASFDDHHWYHWFNASPRAGRGASGRRSTV
jgi:hypothetical protein